VVSVAETDAGSFEDLCVSAGVPCSLLGAVGGSDLVIALSGSVPPAPEATSAGAGLRVPVTMLQDAYESALPRVMGE